MYAPGRVTVPRKQYVKFYHAALLCKKQQLNATQFVKQQLEGMSKTGKLLAERYSQPRLRRQCRRSTCSGTPSGDTL